MHVSLVSKSVRLMKEFFRSFFASMLAIIISGVVLMFIFIGIIGALVSSVKDKSDGKILGNVLTIDLSKRIHESGQANPLAVLTDKSDYDAGLFDIMAALDHARTDNNIKGLLLKLAPGNNGWATAQQLQEAIADFKKSGKFVYAYGEMISQQNYFTATAGDSIYLNPGGDVELKGLATVLTFFKGTLDRLEIQPEIFYAGKFKSATEPFRTDKMSEPNRLQIQAFQGSIWKQFLASSSSFMHTVPDSVDRLVQTGAIQFPSDALQHKVVSALLYWDEVEQRIRAKTGQSEKQKIKYVSIDDYASLHHSYGKFGASKVAVIFAEGEIIDGEQNNSYTIASKDLSDEIRKVRLNDSIKAVVLRVNSPGGSALASEVILRELMLLKQKKHVVVSMGDYAASGGYYISSLADSVFAQPNTITGSIGVFGMFFNIDKLLKNKMGVTFDEVKNAPYADFPTMSRPLTAEEAKRMQTSIDTIYARFKGHVAAGRKLSMADVDSIAQGRVWTGTDALKIGLVDSIGGLTRAIKSAAALAHMTDYRIVTYPAPGDKISNMLKRLGSKTDAKAAMQEAIQAEMGGQYQWLQQLRTLRQMNGRAMMLMPLYIEQ